MSNDTIKRTLFVATSLCVVCSVLVSSAAVYLRPIQEVNKILETKKNILQAAGIYEEGKSIDRLFQNIETRMVDLASGNYVEANIVDPAKFDFKKAAKDPNIGMLIPSNQDLGNIKRRSKYAKIYLLKEDNRLKSIILPIYGKGLWGTMYGFLAIQENTNTVEGLTYYEHVETPGLGGEVDNPLWKSQWKGKKIYGNQWQVRINLPKTGVSTDPAVAVHQVDALSGATITTRGVRSMLQYWMGENGFEPFLTKIRTKEVLHE